MSMGEVKLNVMGLDKLLKALKQSKPPVARVGLLGSKGSAIHGAKAGAPTNAEIGAAHEFGSIARGLPMRSFLRVPIADNLQKRMESSGALDKDVLAQVIKLGDLKPWLEKVAVLAEGISLEAFDTGGFGKWPPWRTKGYTNNTGQILVDTTQLRSAITSEVK